MWSPEAFSLDLVVSFRRHILYSGSVVSFYAYSPCKLSASTSWSNSCFALLSLVLLYPFSWVAFTPRVCLVVAGGQGRPT